MKTRVAISILIPLTLSLCAACSSAPLKVPVLGNTKLLAGRWEGEFRSDDGVRSGFIQFAIQAGQDTAVGDVLLTARSFNWSHVPDYDPRRAQPAVEVIAIKFVTISGNLVRGTMAGYTDPLCECKARTVFDGALLGDTIRGTYRTYHPELHDSHDGVWSVRRSAVYANPRVNGNHAIGEAK
jgi:hypothetical protein